MPINITMPALSPTMEAGTLARWHVKPGDTVKSGQVIAEIETDKATMEVEAVDEGTVLELLVAEGAEDVKVNAVIAVLAGEGEDAAAIAPAGPAEAASSLPAPAALSRESTSPLSAAPGGEVKVNLAPTRSVGGRGRLGRCPAGEGRDTAAAAQPAPPPLIR
jgi:pyruvate/2-oxoglutarate dehydrogenase complex dihydrolipoamide acyltransferase (E2) component